MKATGIVRRIDDLGRVVIPKEIRRTMRIREGDPLEIYTDRDGEVIFKKYSPIGELGIFATQYAEILARTSGFGICITDKDNVIAVSGASKKELMDKKISTEMENTIEEKDTYVSKGNTGKKISVVDGAEKYSAGLICPIIAEGDTIGSVVFLSENNNESYGEVHEKLAQAAAGFLAKQMES